MLTRQHYPADRRLVPIRTREQVLHKAPEAPSYDLPEPTRTPAPAGNLLAQEASGVTYDRDTGTLFVVGDGGTSVTQVTKTGQLVNTMTLRGNAFNDTEGVTYAGGGTFVFTEERLRQLVQFTYTTLIRAATQTSSSARRSATSAWRA